MLPHRWFTPSGYQPKGNGSWALHHGRRLRGLDARQRRDDPDGADTDVIAHASVLGLSACFRQQFNAHTPGPTRCTAFPTACSSSANRSSSFDVVLTASAVALWLKIVITALVLAIYGYLLCRYALLHIPLA